MDPVSTMESLPPQAVESLEAHYSSEDRRSKRSALAPHQAEQGDQALMIARYGTHDRVLILFGRPAEHIVAQQVIALRQELGILHVHQSCFLPMQLPPLHGVHIGPVFRVLRAQILRCVLDGSNLARERDVHYADIAGGLDE